MFDESYVEIPGTNPLQHRTRILGWADRALPPFQEAFLAKDPRMVFCAMIDRNGYLPVHNRSIRIQRPGDVDLEYRQQPQPPHLQRSRGARCGAQSALLSDPELRPRHGQRQDHHDARDRRADPRQWPALGGFPHRVQALSSSFTGGMQPMSVAQPIKLERAAAAPT